MLATLQAAKAVDFFGCLPNHVIEVVDAEQAYIQAEMKGAPNGSVFLPKHARVGGERSSPTCVVLYAVS